MNWPAPGELPTCVMGVCCVPRNVDEAVRAEIVWVDAECITASNARSGMKDAIARRSDRDGRRRRPEP